MNTGSIQCTGAHPAIVPRLWVKEPLTLSQELALGAYVRNPQQDVIGELKLAGLRGRGGAGFPAHVKWSSVAGSAGPTVVVANGEEGEPASRKDYWLLTHRPHMVIDGLLLAAETIGAQRAIIYLSNSEAANAVRTALNELKEHGKPIDHVEVFEVQGSYVAGEETAVCRAINGGPALPTSRPPRPYEKGVDDLPTLVSNVETLAHAAWIRRNGPNAYRDYGNEDSPGTTLVTLNGNCAKPGVYEIPFGITAQEVIDVLGGGVRGPATGLVLGGWFGGVLPAARTDVACSFGACREIGSGWGCGAITVLDTELFPLRFAGQVGRWYRIESARQCGVCIKGTEAIAGAITRLEDGTAAQEDIDGLLRWGNTLPGRGACAFLDGAAALSRSLVIHFPQDLKSHIEKPPSLAQNRVIIK